MAIKVVRIENKYKNLNAQLHPWKEMMVEEDDSKTEKQDSENFLPSLEGTGITETGSCTSENMQKVHFLKR